MFGCSECFGQYQNALATYRAETKAVAVSGIDSWWKKLFAADLLRPIPIFAGAFSLVLLFFIGAYVWREYRAAPEQLVLKPDSAPVVEPSANPSNNPHATTAGPSPSPTRPVERSASLAFPQETNRRKAPVRRPRPRPSRAENLIVMSVDLRDYAMTRGGTVGGDQITVSPARMRMLLTLPEGGGTGYSPRVASRPGMLMTLPKGGGNELYTVSIVDASGDTLETRNVFSTDGKTLAATLNMQRLKPQKYGLRVSRKGEPPIDIPIVIKSPLEVANERTVPPRGRTVVRPLKKP